MADNIKTGAINPEQAAVVPGGTPMGPQGNYDNTLNSPSGNVEITGPGTATLDLGTLFNTATMQRDGKTITELANILSGKRFIKNKINTRVIYGQRWKGQTINAGTVIFESLPLIPTSVYDPLDPTKVSQMSKINYTMNMSQMLQVILEFDITTKLTAPDWPGLLAESMGNALIGNQDATNMYILNIIYASLLGMGKFRFVDLIGKKGSRFVETTPLWSTGAVFQVPANGVALNPDAYGLQTEFSAIRNYATIMSLNLNGGAFNAGININEIKWEASQFLINNMNYSGTQYFQGDLYVEGKRKFTEWLGAFVDANVNGYFQIARPRIGAAPTVKTTDAAGKTIQPQPMAGYGFNNVQDYSIFKNLVGMTFIQEAVVFYETPYQQLNVETGLAHSKRLGYVKTMGGAMIPTYYPYCMMFINSSAYMSGTTINYQQLLLDMTNAQNYIAYLQPGIAQVTPFPTLPTDVTTAIPGNKYGFNFTQLMQYKSLLGFAQPIPATASVPTAAQNVTLIDEWNPSYDEVTLQPISWLGVPSLIPLQSDFYQAPALSN